MTAVLHVTVRALAIVSGQPTDGLPAGKNACGEFGFHAVGQAGGPKQLLPVGTVPTCPTCAVLWDQAVEADGSILT